MKHLPGLSFPILISTQQSWDIEIDSTIKNLASQFSAQNKVLFLNTPLDIKTFLRGSDNPSRRHKLSVLRKQQRPIREINRNLRVLDFPFVLFSINRIPFPWLFNILNYLNNFLIARYVKKTIKQLGWGKDFIVYSDTDIYRSFYLKELLRPKWFVYYKRDNVIIMDYWKFHGSRLEPQLMKKADQVIVNSGYFAGQAKQFNANTADVGTGVNLTEFDPEKSYTEPADLAVIPHPRIGYFGMILAIRLDMNLIDYLSENRPDYQFVFIGKEDEFFSSHPMKQRKNLWFLGHKSLETLPAYTYFLDVCINPQIINEITIGNYPLKIDQYLALGKPVVATRTHAMVQFFEEVCYLADSKESFAGFIDKAILEAPDPQKIKARIQLAQSHSWEKVAEKILQLLRESLS